METMTKSGKVDQRLTSVFNQIFIYLNNEQYIKIYDVYLFPGSEDTFMGRIKIWNDISPFYIVFKRHNLQNLNIKGYKNCMFIPNIFRFKTDKKGNNFLSCTNNHADTMLKYYPIKDKEQYKRFQYIKNNGTSMFIGLSEDSEYGEAYEIIKLN